MAEYWEKMLFDDTREMLDSGSADFLTADELKFIGKRTDEMFVDFTRGVPELDMEAAGTLADFAKRTETGNIPKTQEEIEDNNEENPGGMTFFQDGDLVVSMNAEKYPDYSDAMKVRLLHELRHVWQRRQDSWKTKFGDGITTKTDMDIERDAFENQILLERIFGIESNFGTIFRSIEERVKTSRQSDTTSYNPLLEG